MSRTKKFVAVAALGVGSTIASFNFAAGAQDETRGTIPDEAFEGGQLDLARVPDLIEVLDREGTSVGYVRRDDLYPTSREGEILDRNSSIPVYDKNNKQIGDWLANQGFVAGGETRRIETAPVTTAVAD